MTVMQPQCNTADMDELYDQVMMKTFAHPQRIFTRAEGVWIYDDHGRKYLDLLCGLAVTGLGHCHPAVVDAISDQAATLGHISNIFASKPQIQLAAKLAHLVAESFPVEQTDPQARVFFTNSGAEANEAAFKLTRLTGRTKIIAMEGSFHGRTAAALAVTANRGYREPFEPLPGEVIFVPYGDGQALARALDEDVAAVVLEPIQGENGVVVPSCEYLAEVRALCDSVSALMWVDEVQTGMGRCGYWFAAQHSRVRPDIITIAKGLGNGFPVGACLALGKASTLFAPGHHGTTFGGNPVAAAAGLAVLDVIESEGLLQRARDLGDYLASSLNSLESPLIREVRGLGLLRGIVFVDDISAKVCSALLDRGFITNAPRPSVLRLAPALITTTEQIDMFVIALADILDGYA